MADNIEILTLNKKNIKDFSFERNKLLKNSKSNWVLFLDYDEKLDSEGIATSQAPRNDTSCYYLIRKNYFLNQFVGSDKIIRLIKKGTGKWVRRVHETWHIEKGHPRCVLNNYIIHNTADNLSTYINKINNYSTLHARANFEEGKKSNLFKIIFFPVGKFIITLTKSKNIVFSIMQSLHSFLSWTKLYFLQF